MKRVNKKGKNKYKHIEKKRKSTERVKSNGKGIEHKKNEHYVDKISEKHKSKKRNETANVIRREGMSKIQRTEKARKNSSMHKNKMNVVKNDELKKKSSEYTNENNAIDSRKHRNTSTVFHKRTKISANEPISAKTERNRLKGLKKVEHRDLMKQLSKEYEIARVKKTEKKQRVISINKIVELCKGNFAKLCYKRNTAKIIQCLIKYADKKLLELIFNEIISDLINIISRPFGSYVSEKLYMKKRRYKDAMFTILRKNLKTIIIDRVAIHFIDDFYSDLLNKNVFLEGMYSNERDVLYSDKEMPLEKIDIEFTINKMISKGLLNLEISHDILDLYLRILYAKKRESGTFLRSLVEFVPDFLYTENGLKIAILTYDLVEDKSTILDGISSYFLKISVDEYGIEFLLHLLKTLEGNNLHLFKCLIFKSSVNLMENENSSKLILQCIDHLEINDDIINSCCENLVQYLSGYNCDIMKHIIPKSDKLIQKGFEIMDAQDEELAENDKKAKVILKEILDKIKTSN